MRRDQVAKCVCLARQAFDSSMRLHCCSMAPRPPVFIKQRAFRSRDEIRRDDGTRTIRNGRPVCGVRSLVRAAHFERCERLLYFATSSCCMKLTKRVCENYDRLGENQQKYFFCVLHSTAPSTGGLKFVNYGLYDQ